MMFLLTCDKKLTKSQLSPTHASTKRKITAELKHNAGRCPDPNARIQKTEDLQIKTENRKLRLRKI